MKRHPVLQDLSRDHYFALEQGQRLRRVQSDTLDIVSEGFLQFWHGKMVHHFREEEEVLLPILSRHCPANHPVLVTVLVEHVDIARHAIDLESRPRDVVIARGLGMLIDRHVHHEETVLFPMIETTLPEAELADLGSRLAAFAPKT